ncbi:protocatechuate 3,4-dioxygenase subunit alpha [Allobranchiibius sp. CTAmp26]|uniref:protocatechuate 3,4-dioxygenase subunit alpha n=1 Tax=Allobranchiibius sp. CTAmp26 TaxID=2815214 RepID=UPI001AA1C4AB|nr:protocatechuate 3,4-dioxygenase subunit alpha [Allobranchiibius sp. CTAmp26]MBO1754581.1 protocatechuate 3,4-dioxygenase subunit alpha [Allobranchiibius sp. CTAmp26]
MPELDPTPGQTIGPFFAYALPYDRDYELVRPTTTGAVRLHGTVYDGAGSPVPDALLEIRQADGAGAVPTVEGSIRRDGTAFTGWGRCQTDSAGRYSFTTIAPGGDSAPFVAVVVFARGLLHRLFTRAYLPEASASSSPFLASLEPRIRERLIAVRDDDGGLLFDIHLQGELETPFLTFPGEA